MISGNGTLSIRKRDLQNQNNQAIGFTKIRFAHKAVAGETGINLTSLTTPTEMAANGFVQPTTSQLTSANLLFYKNNLTLTSSARGKLIVDISYSVASSTQLNFLGFTALEGEIFEGIIDYSAQSGTQVVDASAQPATGTLAATQTDFNIGQSFQTNKYSSTQLGAVLVYKDRVLQRRNTGNSSLTLDGDYYELDNGSGSFSIIRFNVADPDNSSEVWITPNGLLSERPDGSMMAVIENVNGYIQNMAPYVAAATGQTVSTVLGAAPTNTDLKSFGDLVTKMNSGHLMGTPTDDDALSGEVGYVISAVRSTQFSQSSPTALTFYDTGLTLVIPSAGDWQLKLTASVQLAMTGGTGFGFVYCAIRDSSNNSVISGITCYLAAANTSSINTVALIDDIKLSTSGTYKMSIAYNNSGGTPTGITIYSRDDLVTAKLSARRMR